MTRIRAKYHHGTCTPTQPVKLKEGSVVDILIEIPDEIRQRHDPRKAYELIREMASMAHASSEGGTIGQDHDEYLYTEDWKR